MTATFRPVVHPGQSDTLVHFCSRGRDSKAQTHAHLAPVERLESILRTMRLDAFPPHGADHPVVCLSESAIAGVESLLAGQMWAPWGVVLCRSWVWDQGGGPVWYVRDDVTSSARKALDARTNAWLVRTKPGDADWLHEREWRVPCEPSSPHLSLYGGALVAILVGDPNWTPPLGLAIEPHPMTGEPIEVGRSNPKHSVPRWWWDGTRIVPLGPVPEQFNPEW